MDKDGILLKKNFDIPLLIFYYVIFSSLSLLLYLLGVRFYVDLVIFHVLCVMHIDYLEINSILLTIFLFLFITTEFKW